MNKRIINLGEAAKARGRELSPPLPDEEEFDLLGSPEGVFTFPLDDFVQDREGRPLFVSPQKLERAKNVFSRWGLDMRDYSESMDTFLAAWYALAGKSNFQRDLMVGEHVTYGAEQEA